MIAATAYYSIHSKKNQAMDKDNKNLPYIWVQTSIYKEVDKPLISGDTNRILIPWNMETLKRDLKPDEIKSIKRYDGFVCIPSHTDYQQEISTFYNEYHKLEFEPKNGSIDISLKFVKHIFGEQYELGLDYLQLLYLYPSYILPVLCLISRERGTGKTLFLLWLKSIFGKNMTINTNDDFRSQFNSHWSNKVLIGVDEVLLDRKEDSERIKNLSTARVFQSEAKGKDRAEVEFFGKFVLCSNNESNFIYIDNEEIRFWIRRIPSLSDIFSLDEINDILHLLKNEIPAFLYFLKNRKLSTSKCSRMWFSEEQISTESLRKLKFSNRSKSEKEIVNHLMLVMEIENIESISFTPIDLINLLKINGFKLELTEVRRILKDKWKLKPQDNSNNYTKYLMSYDGSVSSLTSKGRYYTITKEFITRNFDDFDE